ncbi:MAG: molecular chaperone HtpG [Eubacteriaceae bacterium]|uniref:Chaperone protein HtpG n=1 Tax=Candidatus Pseudoramibacter fermentans TaxID=2594427 RepID=A0A6L5GPR7_9FIRM|nr:molecular chaperone HtpG [Candidatus Pseudoramibacter fermentans]RRF92230.1 MAG: molecular chaperone HtpG [Eubacteriaceae bacterium]
MAKKEFKAESKRLLDLMVNSIYTNKEIFLRELISNASDAIDKRYFKASQEGQTGLSRNDYPIYVARDEDARTLTITDCGIGMTDTEMENNLGTIAQSGSLDFKTENAKEDGTDALDIIGQFGVGFYSAFMVAKKIRVVSKAEGSDKAYAWESEGADGYTIEPAERDDVGTTITLFLRDDTDDDKYSDYLKEWKLRDLIKKYSDYIRYPIIMNVTKQEPLSKEEKEAAEADENGKKPEFKTVHEDETINSMVPIWKRSKSEVTTEEYNEFYKDKFVDWEDPQKIISTNVEGLLSYNALLFIPSRVPYNFYSKDYKRGLQLYSSGVLIMDKCEDLLPDYFGFVRGLVDSQDISLNISREMLQQDRQVKAIANRLEKKIISELKDMMAKDREGYEKFFNNFGLRLKFGIYDNFGANKDKLKDLVMFYSSTEDKLVTFQEYVDRMKEDQKYIYYATGDSIDKIKRMPQNEMLMDKGYEVLFCTEEVDEFALKVLNSYNDKPFKSTAEDDLGIEMSDEEKAIREKQSKASEGLLNSIKDALDGKVADVKLSTRLKSHPVCFSAGEGISIEMEKVLAEQSKAVGQTPTEDMKAKKVLEINGDHPVFAAMRRVYEADDKDTLKDYAELLYDQAMLIEGMPIDDPVDFSNRVCRLMK